MKKPTVLALDLGSYTGWAFGSDPKVCQHGWTCFIEKDKTFNEKSFAKFGQWLKNDIKIMDLVVVEKPNSRMPGFHAYRVLFGMYGIVQEICGLYHKPMLSVSATTIKKYWTGSGFATKEQMVRATNERLPYPRVENHNESDAIALYHFQMEDQ